MSGKRSTTLHLDLMWSAGAEPRQRIEPELFALLEAIRETAKLTTATARVGMQYRQAWGLITKWSGVVGQPLVAKEQGRGTRLTGAPAVAAGTDRSAAVAASRKRGFGNGAATERHPG